jgi:hypothetical protein
MFWWNWRAASVLAAWIVPCLITYTFYYWAPDSFNSIFSIGYLRFFTTILPGLALCFYWLMSRLSAWAKRHHGPEGSPGLSLAVTIIAGLLMTAVVGWALQHVRLWQHDPANAELHRNWLTNLLRPTDSTGETDTARLAKIELYAFQFGALAAGVAAALIALCLARGRAVVPVVGAGLFTCLVVAIQLTDSLPTMQDDQGGRFQVEFKADAIHAAVPEGSVIFCQEQNLLNDVQFVGDYSLYDGESFRRDWVQNLPNIAAPDLPQGLDPGRRDALYNRLKDFSQGQLDEQARGIMHDALIANRRVFFVIQMRPNEPIPKKVRKAMGLSGKNKIMDRMPDLVARFCTPARFSTEVASVWPGYVPVEEPPADNKPRGLRMPPPSDPLGIKQPLELIEVTLAQPGSGRG